MTVRLGACFLALVAGIPAAGCGGGGPVCGDGNVDQGELCDDGNQDDTDYCKNDCTPRSIPQLTVKWQFNKDAAPGFDGDSCTDLGVDRVAVEIDSDAGSFEADEFCSFRQVVFQDIPSGQYQVKLRLLDADEALLTTAPVKQMYSFNGGSRDELVVDVTPDLWAKSYRGTFFFRVSWAGGDCDSANPPVAQQLLTLEQHGAKVKVSTMDGDPLDGSAPGPCRSLEEPFPQAALDVPFGPATFTVVGLDEGGGTAFEKTFDTFVGAGASNPELMFETDSLLPDAGAPDAESSDGGPPDA